MKVNKHDITMVGIRKVCSSLQGLGYRRGEVEDIYYDRSTGKVSSLYSATGDLGRYRPYFDDADIIPVASVSKPHTMQWIADHVADAVAKYAHIDAENAKLSI